MNYGSCSCCKKVTKYADLPLCEECKNNFIHAVKDYIYENGVHTAKEIHDATGVPVRVIEYFMNHDYLDGKNNVNMSEQKKIEDEKFLQRMELIQKLQGSFSNKETAIKNPEKELTGEYHFMGRKGK